MNVLLIVYKIEKDKGSEDGSGYNIALRMVKKYKDITIISRRNNIELLKSDPDFKTATLIGVDVPKALSFYKKGGRGIIAYYYLWQIFVARLVKELQVKSPFDVVHQLNFHGDWAPHFLRNPNGKLIWGPIAHHEPVPRDFLPQGDKKAVLSEILKEVVKQAFWRIDPFLRAAIRRTDVIAYANRNLAPPFAANAGKVIYQSYASSFDARGVSPVRPDKFTVLTVGRLVPLKGFAASLEAFSLFTQNVSNADAELVIVGAGELEAQLKQRTTELGLSDFVRFVPWVNQAELAAYYSAASAFLYPSFESQGLVVAEAMGSGVPVICLENSGPSFLAERSGEIVPRATFVDVARSLSERLGAIYSEYRLDQDEGAYTRRKERTFAEYRDRLDWDVVAANFQALYKS
jgi:glycosyltransferase involved in cell wall biosynthesis